MDEYAAAHPHGIAVVEAAILVETGSYRDYAKLIVAVCSEEQQIERAMSRDGMTREQVLDRLSRQMPLAEKIKYADYVIDTSGAKENTLAQTQRRVSSPVSPEPLRIFQLMKLRTLFIALALVGAFVYFTTAPNSPLRRYRRAAVERTHRGALGRPGRGRSQQHRHLQSGQGQRRLHHQHGLSADLFLRDGADARAGIGLPDQPRRAHSHQQSRDQRQLENRSAFFRWQPLYREGAGGGPRRRPGDDPDRSQEESCRS